MKKLALADFTAEEVVSSIISLDRLSVFGWGPETITEADEEQQPLGQQLQDSDYNSAMEDEEDNGSASSTSLQPSTQHLLPYDQNSIPMDMFATSSRNSNTFV